MNTNGFNHQFQSGMPPGQPGYFQPPLSRLPFLSSSQMPYQRAYWQGTPRQAWEPPDGFISSYALPGTHQGVPQWAQSMQNQAVPRQQLFVQPIGDFRQFLQQPSVPQHAMLGYHPQHVREYYPQLSEQPYRTQPPAPEGLSQQSVQELVGAAAVQLGYTRNVEPPARAMIVQCANNDKIVIDALKQGQAKGLNGLRAIEKLGNVCPRSGRV